jgi:hypothetical protein
MTQPNTPDTNTIILSNAKLTLPNTAVNTNLYNVMIDITQSVSDIHANGWENTISLFV